MAYKQFPTDRQISEIQHRARLDELERPIIEKHSAELRAKVRPTVEELPTTASDNDIRSALTTELSKVLKPADVPYAIESLSKANDLRSFYRFARVFLAQIKGIRNLDASFLLDLWGRFKSKMLIESAKPDTIPFPGQTAAEYERSLRVSGKPVYIGPTSSQLNELSAMGQEDTLPQIKEMQKYRAERRQLEDELSIAESARQRNTILSNLKKLQAKEVRKQNLLNRKQIQNQLQATEDVHTSRARKRVITQLQEGLSRHTQYAKEHAPYHIEYEGPPSPTPTFASSVGDEENYSAPYGLKQSGSPRAKPGRKIGVQKRKKLSIIGHGIGTPYLSRR